MAVTVCTALWHRTWYALRHYGCVCPEAYEDHRRRVRRSNANRPYIRGRAANLCGSRRGVDPVAVERAAGGDRALRLTVAERRAAIDLLDAQGFTAADVAARLGITVRTVQRQRTRRRQLATTTEETRAA